MSLQFVLYTFRTYYIQLYDYKNVLSPGRFGRESFRPEAVRRSRPCALHRRRRNAAVRSDEAEAAKLRS